MSKPAPESAADVKNPITPRSTERKPVELRTPTYWKSPTGRNVLAVLGMAAGGLYFGGHTALHTFLLEKYQNAVQLHRNGFPTPLSPDMVVRCQETLRDMRLKNANMVSFFAVYGMDVFHAGSLQLRGGSIIGVPVNFTYSKKEHIDKQDIQVNNEFVEWGSDGGQLLQDALILSERAQKFGIAREITLTNTRYPWVDGGIGSGSITAYIMATKFINDKFYGLYRPVSFRLCVYALVGTLTVGLWTTMTDLANKYYEKWADKTVGSMSLDYAKGGVEFYSKILQRNMALRTLMGVDGEKRFTFYGNDVEYIRQRHVPFSERKANLENLAELLSSQNQQNLNGSADDSNE